MNRRFFIFLISCFGLLFLSACAGLESVGQVPDVSQFQNDPFYAEMLNTVELVKIPIIVVALLSLVVGWKIGRLGLAINAFVIAGVIIYTFLGRLDFVSDDTIKIGMTIVSALISGILAYFLYNLMALIVGGLIGTILMNGAWFQAVEQVPPIILVFITTFISALVMFLVFRLFLVAFSAIIGAVILMIAIPFPTFWVIPVAGFGIVCQMGIALLIKDDIFQNMKGDFGAALREAFGDVLGPFGVLFDRQKEERESKAVQKPSQSSSSSRDAQRTNTNQPNKPSQPSYQPQQRPISQQTAQPYQASRTVNQAPQANRPQQANQQNKPSVLPTPITPTEINLQRPTPTAFRPENFYFQLSTGETYSLPAIGSQMTLGRSLDASITVNDLSVSGTHLIINIQDNGILVWDNQTTNGSLFNGYPLTGSALLTPADVVKIGDTTLRLMHRVTYQ